MVILHLAPTVKMSL